jgi:hypothetical protein
MVSYALKDRRMSFNLSMGVRAVVLDPLCSKTVRRVCTGERFVDVAGHIGAETKVLDANSSTCAGCSGERSH